MSIDLFHIQLSISLLSSFFRIFPIPFHKWFFILYSSLWIILTLHLSFIWDFTWVSVPLNISSGSLWVVITRVSLFRFLLHMNAVRKVVLVNLMQWQQLFLGSFVLSLLPFKSIGHVLLSLNFLEGSSNCWDINLRYMPYSRVFSSSDIPPCASYLWDPILGLYYLLAISSDILLSSNRPMTQRIILGPYPHSMYVCVYIIINIKINHKTFPQFRTNYS